MRRGFTLLLDDTGHRKSGNFTAGVGRQYIGEIGKLDDGKKSADSKTKRDRV
ncbi:Mobile element protein [Geitlerinema sp. FC II]|nr:Mobile element protein [Geitlerinema sp. FC II]